MSLSGFLKKVIRKGTKMFIAHYKTIAKRKAQVFGIMIIATGTLGLAGLECLFMDDMFAIVTGIGMISIASVGVPWSILGCLFSIQDMRD
jgi:hypothetical protein